MYHSVAAVVSACSLGVVTASPASELLAYEALAHCVCPCICMPTCHLPTLGNGDWLLAFGLAIATSVATGAANVTCASSVGRATSATSDVLGLRFALHVLKDFVIKDNITLNQVSIISKVDPVSKEILTSIVLQDESETLHVIKKLDCASLAHAAQWWHLQSCN